MTGSNGKLSGVSRGGTLSRGLIFFLAACTILACNAPFVVGQNATPNPQTTLYVPNDTTSPSVPQVVIEAPGSGTQAVLQRPFTVRVHATDSLGITRVEMRESGRMVVSLPSPEPNPDLVALMQYLPTSVGPVTLEVVAYRQSVASSPVSIKVEVVGSEAQLSNPNSLDPTSGVAAGIICTARVNVSGLAFRNGPATNYRILDKLPVGEVLTVIGRNADLSWYQVKRTGGAIGWVNGGYTSAEGDCTKAPEVTPAP